MPKPKKEFIIESVQIPIYPGRFVMMMGDDIKKAQKYLGDLIEDDEELYAHAFLFNYLNQKAFGVLINFEYDWPVTYGTIAHECLHSALRMAEMVGMKSITTEQEPIAYLHEWFVDEYMKFLKKHDKIKFIK